jgi:hypothetical protein
LVVFTSIILLIRSIARLNSTPTVPNVFAAPCEVHIVLLIFGISGVLSAQAAMNSQMFCVNRLLVERSVKPPGAKPIRDLKNLPRL